MILLCIFLVNSQRLLYVIFKNRAGVHYRDLKHEAIAECLRPNKARTVSFLNVL